MCMCLQVRETETWMPPKAGESHDDLDSSGDFIFPKEDSTLFDDEDAKGYDDASGSGDDESFVDGSFATSEVGAYPAHKSIK